MNKQTETTYIKTLSVRVRDKHARLLRQYAFEVNQIWNAANAYSAEWSRIPIPGVGWMYPNIVSAFDLQKELKGIRAERNLGVGSSTFQEVIAVHAKCRKQFKRDKLRWRVSGGSKRALGWVPFKKGAAVWKNGQVQFNGHHFKVYDSYGLSGFGFRSGSFSEDARGRWYFNIVVECERQTSNGRKSVGVDLGLKTIATCSDGTRLDNARLVSRYAEKLAIAQRARNKKRVRAIHAKIKNTRKDVLHKFSTKLVEENAFIVVGNVSSKALAKTNMAKSVLDAGWFMLKTQLKYKANARSVVFEEVDEKYTTQTCSCCGCISSNSPKGRAGLGIREWECAECGAKLDRDINAAKNILALGHQRLVEGIPFL